MFPALRSIPSCTTDTNLRSCILNRHKMRQSQIATFQESLPSHFVICRILWSWPWRHKLSPITLKTCSGYLGEYPCSLLTWIPKVSFLPILVLFHWYICLCVCLSVIKLIIDVPRKSSWKVPILMWTCFLHLGVHPRLLWNLSEQLHFELSQIATVTNCDNSGIPAVAICDLSQFVIKAVTAQTESNNIENVFCVLGRVPMIKLHILTLSQIATLSVTNCDIRHKLRHFQSQIATPSQIATITNCYVTIRCATAPVSLKKHVFPSYMLVINLCPVNTRPLHVTSLNAQMK